jgi:hypothetical protein
MEDDNNLPEIEQLKQWLRDNRQALIEAGILVFEATYEGDGDEGSFQGIEALDGQGVPLEYSLPDEIADLIESLGDKLALPGYQDGTGGGGELRLQVEEGSITHEAYSFVIERSSHGLDTY